MQVIYDADVITAVCKVNVPVVQDNRNMEVCFLQASHVARGNPSLKNMLHDTFDSHVKRPFV